jgi:hypothetical protein
MFNGTGIWVRILLIYFPAPLWRAIPLLELSFFPLYFQFHTWLSTQINLIYKTSNCSFPVTVIHEIIILNVKNFLQALPTLLLPGLFGHARVRGAFLACKRYVTTSVWYRILCLKDAEINLYLTVIFSILCECKAWFLTLREANIWGNGTEEVSWT